MSEIQIIRIKPPHLLSRIISVWFRHYRVYTNNIISNGIPVFLEPLFFLLAIGFGLGTYVDQINGMDYVLYLASGILVPPTMFTAAYECTFGTFVRLEFDHVYDGMLSSSITYKDLIVGEILFAGTKGLFFSACVLIVISSFGLVSLPMALLAPIGGFLNGIMFACLSLFITSFVKTINHFNFYFTGLLTPMFFFSGIVFPLSNIPSQVRWIAECLPLTHATRIVRGFCLNQIHLNLGWDLLYIIGFIIVFGYLAIISMKRRLIN